MQKFKYWNSIGGKLWQIILSILKFCRRSIYSPRQTNYYRYSRQKDRHV